MTDNPLLTNKQMIMPYLHVNTNALYIHATCDWWQGLYTALDEC